MKKLEKDYEQLLDRFVDILFLEATDHYSYTWREFAKAAGVAYSTVYRLGMRDTHLPYLRTIYKLAKAVDLEMQLTAMMKRRGIKREEVTHAS